MVTTTPSLQLRATFLAIVLVSFNYPVESFSTSSTQRIITSTSSTQLHQDIAKATVTESETDAQIRNRILDEIDSGLRSYTEGSIDLAEYGEPEDALITDDDDDPGAIDARTLGEWS